MTVHLGSWYTPKAPDILPRMFVWGVSDGMVEMAAYIEMKNHSVRATKKKVPVKEFALKWNLQEVNKKGERYEL